MKEEIVKELFEQFEECVHKTDTEVEYWYARDLQKLLGYNRRENFLKVIEKAKESLKNSGAKVSEHVADVSTSLKMPNGGEKATQDYILTRYACYLIAQNGDPRKTTIAFAQTYFAIQTRKFEILQERINDAERIVAREKLAQSEKHLSGIIYERTKDEKSFGYIRSKGDEALFGVSTEKMKQKWGVKKSQPLADYSPTVVLKGKDFANELTIFNTKEKDLNTTNVIAQEHVENNATVRKAMIERGIHPEKLKPEKDIKSIKRKLSSKKDKELKNQ